eukprot:COSAG06_NODE_25885_length_626_cov_2.901328_1_plen_147_part_10
MDVFSFAQSLPMIFIFSFCVVPPSKLYVNIISRTNLLYADAGRFLLGVASYCVRPGPTTDPRTPHFSRKNIGVDMVSRARRPIINRPLGICLRKKTKPDGKWRTKLTSCCCWLITYRCADGIGVNDVLCLDLRLQMLARLARASAEA